MSVPAHEDGQALAKREQGRTSRVTTESNVNLAQVDFSRHEQKFAAKARNQL